jgi:lincosamide nucleotidyltransferase A/C/D/E
MTAGDVLMVLDPLEGVQVRAWLDGGWGIDALVGHQHRDHRDLDLVVELLAVDALVATLAGIGFVVAEDHLPTRLVLRGDDGRQVDVHPVTFDANGTGWQAGASADGTDCPYPAAGFTTGAVAGRSVGCLTAEVQVAHHSGYPPDEIDRHDMRLLQTRFHVRLPSPY